MDQLPHTQLPDRNAFAKGQPERGAHLADDLERLVALHGADTIVAMIVEPMAGSTGDIMAMSPPLIISKAGIDRLIGTLGDVLRNLV